MIAQVVFDLPLEGSFDYLIPPSLENRARAGMRVEVTLGFRRSIGLIVGVIEKSAFDNLKFIKSVIDEKALLDAAQITLGHDLSAYYGCSLGDVLFTMVRSCDKDVIAAPLNRSISSKPSLHLSSFGHYEPVLTYLIKPFAQDKQRVLILVADQYTMSATEQILKQHFSKEDYVIGMRSSVFRSFADIALVIMIDEDNASFKQEQTPMYETRQVLLMRAKSEKVPVAFVSTTPTVEIMRLVEEKQIRLCEYPPSTILKPQVVDLNNYKIMFKGILSPAVMSTIESCQNKKLKSVLVFNHRGSYAMTRCEECSFVLKCQRCDSPVTYSRVRKQYVCRYCSFTLPTETLCPNCKIPKWKSFGLGVEQLQKALQDRFPLAKVHSFERGSKEVPKDFDILIGTWALLRFKNQITAQLVAFLDIDSELNRMDMRSCFRAWSMIGHLRGMAQGQLLVQSRQIDHYVISSVAKDKPAVFYQEDMKVRQELGFSPFAHQVHLMLRGKEEEKVEKLAQEFYQALIKLVPKDIQVSSPTPEGVAHKRGQYRLNILLQGQDVIAMIATIKQAQAKIKRRARVIVTINVDP